jgi:hypothetical protein
MLPPEIYLESTRVAHFNVEDQTYIRELDSNLYALQHMDIVAPGAYVLAEVDGGMLSNTWNADQLCKYYA